MPLPCTPHGRLFWKYLNWAPLFFYCLKIICLLDVSEIFKKQDCEGTRTLIVILFILYLIDLCLVFFPTGPFHYNFFFKWWYFMLKNYRFLLFQPWPHGWLDRTKSSSGPTTSTAIIIKILRHEVNKCVGLMTQIGFWCSWGRNTFNRYLARFSTRTT